MEKIVFVGAGSMAEAVIAGICKQKTVNLSNIYVMNRADDARLFSLQQTYGISIVSSDRRELLAADVVVLATKPKDVKSAMKQITSLISDETLVLSVVAGVSIKTIETELGNRPVARCMPNTSATIGKSATGVAWNNYIGTHQKEHILTLLHSIGVVVEVCEQDLHAVTALSGSGPAYIYYLAEALESAALQVGLEQKVARELIIQTIEGAANMLRITKEQPAILRGNVTSPGGTTEAGIRALVDAGFNDAISSCIQSAQQRSYELGSPIDKTTSSSS